LPQQVLIVRVEQKRLGTAPSTSVRIDIHECDRRDKKTDEGSGRDMVTCIMVPFLWIESWLPVDHGESMWPMDRRLRLPGLRRGIIPVVVLKSPPSRAYPGGPPI
jgi:hypothetical protein